MMGKKCEVITCKKVYTRYARSSGVSFHKFPADPILRDEWEQRCGQLKPLDCSKSYICSQHFLDEDYELCYKDELLKSRNMRHILKKNAIPKRNLPPNVSQPSLPASSKLEYLSPTSKAIKRKKIVEELLQVSMSAETPISTEERPVSAEQSPASAEQSPVSSASSEQSPVSPASSEQSPVSLASAEQSPVSQASTSAETDRADTERELYYEIFTLNSQLAIKEKENTSLQYQLAAKEKEILNLKNQLAKVRKENDDLRNSQQAVLEDQLKRIFTPNQIKLLLRKSKIVHHLSFNQR